MASVCILGLCDIDYSLVDGRIRSFELRGETLYDESSGVSFPDWKSKCIEVVRTQGLDKDDGKGLHAFVKPLLLNENGDGN